MPIEDCTIWHVIKYVFTGKIATNLLYLYDAIVIQNISRCLYVTIMNVLILELHITQKLGLLWKKEKRKSRVYLGKKKKVK